MADATYQPQIYRKQGGSEMVVASSGIITVESGGKITIETGGSVLNPTLLTTVASTFVNHGVYAIDITSTSGSTHTIGAPVVGCELTICVIGVSTVSTGHLVATNSTNVSIGTSLRRFARFTVQDTFLQLHGVSTTQWAVGGMSGTGVTLST